METKQNTDWININDKLPEEDTFYLVTDGVDVDTNWFCSIRGRFGRSEMIITHWQPYPNPPR